MSKETKLTSVRQILELTQKCAREVARHGIAGVVVNPVSRLIPIAKVLSEYNIPYAIIPH